MAAVAVLAAGPSWAERKVAPTEAECPADLPVRRMDATGKADLCAQEAAPTCGAALVLRIDAAGIADRCVRPGRPAARGRRRTPDAVVGPPACTAPLALHVQPKADVCERTGPPVCEKDFTLTPTAGEDRCVPGKPPSPKAK
ncbi:MAG: hypothetical protein DMF78_03680 [Acidobacteria bacterium]|nr:MAG: hypothetical protein DMF78_03680 [Acidobacteriota bacterium]